MHDLLPWPTDLNIITYLVSSRGSIEIWRVCKIYWRRGSASPSIYFTNPPYFYRPSGTDQISVLFRQGHWIVYAVTKIGQKSTQAAYTVYSRDFCAKMWRYDLRGRHHKRSCEKRTTRRYAVVKINEEINFSSLLNLFRVRAKLAGISKCLFCFLYIQIIILIARMSHSNGDVVCHLGFLNRFFCLLTVYKKVYRVIDRVHVTGFIQSVSDILVRGEIIINRDHRVIKDYVPTKFEAFWAKCSRVIHCTRYKRPMWPLTLIFNLVTWISIGIIYSSRSIYLRTKFGVYYGAKRSWVISCTRRGRSNELWPPDLNTNRDHLLIKDYCEIIYFRGAQFSWIHFIHVVGT